MTTRAVLALDLGNMTGWCVAAPNGTLQHGSRDFADLRQDGARFLAFRHFLHEQKLKIEAAGGELGLVLYEAIDFRHASIRAAQVYGGYRAMVLAWCEHHEITAQGLRVQDIRFELCGKRGATKEQAFEEILGLGYKARDKTEADAIAVLHVWRTREAQRAEQVAA